MKNYAPPLLGLHSLSDDEKVTYARLRRQLRSVQQVNMERIQLFEGSNKVRHLDIAIPPGPLQDLQTVTGWAGTGIEVLAERLSWDNWTSSGDLMDLDVAYRENYLDDESDKTIIDALICGTSFITTGKGDSANGEPEILVTGESPLDCTMLWDSRARRGTAALSRTLDALGRVTMETFYLLNETITLERTDDGRMVIRDRDHHGFNRLPVARLVNRGRTSRGWGRSELTPAVRYFNDAAARTLLGMEINREFYTTPQRWIMGADMEMFTDENGDLVSAWQTIAGHMLAAPNPVYEDEETNERTVGDAPTVGQFSPASPAPYIDQIRHYSMMFAAEVGFPANYLGYATENPASADAIRAGEIRLINRSRRRQAGFTRGLRDVAYNVLLWRDGKVNMTEFAKVMPNWTDPAPTTPTAAADEAVKLIGVGVLTPDSDVTYRKVGLDSTAIAQIEADKRKARAANRLALRANQAQPEPSLPAV